MITNRDIPDSLARSITMATTISTAYLDNSGNTILYGKRDSIPTPVAAAKRALTTGSLAYLPRVLLGYNRADLTTICGCIGPPAPIVTRIMAARPSVGKMV